MNAPAKSVSRAERVQHVVSPGGVAAWLVEDYAVPLVAMEFSFLGGAAQDPQGKAGAARCWPACSTKARAILTRKPSIAPSTIMRSA